MADEKNHSYRILLPVITDDDEFSADIDFVKDIVPNLKEKLREGNQKIKKELTRDYLPSDVSLDYLLEVTGKRGDRIKLFFSGIAAERENNYIEIYSTSSSPEAKKDTRDIGLLIRECVDEYYAGLKFNSQKHF